jgi:hypothetical protein
VIADRMRAVRDDVVATVVGEIVKEGIPLQLSGVCVPSQDLAPVWDLDLQPADGDPVEVLDRLRQFWEDTGVEITADREGLLVAEVAGSPSIEVGLGRRKDGTWHLSLDSECRPSAFASGTVLGPSASS